jgi:hypothetical protein
MVPQGRGGLEDAKRLFIRMRLQGVEAFFTWTSEECPPRCLLLDKKMVWLKFKKCIIISCKMINRKKIFVGMWDMKNIF